MRRSTLSLLVVLALSTSAAGCAANTSNSSDTSHQAPSSSATGGGADGTAAADFTGDGSDPAVVANAPLGTAPAFLRTSMGGSYGTLAADAPIDARRFDAITCHIAAEVERRYPGMAARYVEDLGSGDKDKMTAARGWIDGALAEAADSKHVLEAVASDPLFAELTTQDVTGLHFDNHSGSGGTGSGGSNPNLGKGSDGKFGDSRTGPSGLLADSKDVQPGLLDKLDTMNKIDRGELSPDPESRLGAYAATGGYPAGTVGNAAHNAIGGIYGAMGTFGEEKIGRVFNSPEAKALFPQPVESAASGQLATLEHGYWSGVKAEDPWSAGGNMGSMFNPSARDFIQKHMPNWRGN